MDNASPPPSAQRWTAQHYFDKYGISLRSPNYCGPQRNAKLMLLFVALIGANPDFSSRFIRKGQKRRFYDTTKGKKPLIRYCEVGNLCCFFQRGGDGSEMAGLLPKVESYERDYFLNDGCLLGVRLLHEDGRVGAIFIDLDENQIQNEALPRVLAVLDKAEIQYVLEISSSGQGCHVWIPLNAPMPAANAVAWLQRVLDDGGLRKKEGKTKPNDYDEIKPTGGSGGVVIVAHFFDDSTSCLAKVIDGKLVAMDDAESATAMAEFRQRASVLDEIATTEATDHPLPKARSGNGARKFAHVNWEESLGLVNLDDVENERQAGILDLCVQRNPRLQELVATASGQEKGNRSEAAWRLFHVLVVEHGFHPQTVASYCAQWPRYLKRSVTSELLRALSNSNIRRFLEGCSPWRGSIIRHVSKDQGDTSPATTPSVLSFAEARLARAKKDVESGITKKNVIIFDLAPGSFKTTVEIPAFALKAAYHYSTGNETFATVLRERREDALATATWFNMIPRRVACG